jgi:hypothetical protein
MSTAFQQTGNINFFCRLCLNLMLSLFESELKSVGLLILKIAIYDNIEF